MPENDVSARILYLSETCAAVNKLSGEAVEGAGRGMADLPRLLAAALAAKGEGAFSGNSGSLLPPAAVNRLDVPVTGCALFALKPGALRFLNAAFREGGGSGGGKIPAVEKRYWAIVEKPSGEMPIAESGELVHWLQFDPGKNKSVAWDEPGPGRKKAVLKYRLAGMGKNYLFLEIDLITGRHHQIRAQLARMGLSVRGDLKYGARRSEKNDVFRGGIRLHARSLSFPDPSENGKRITVEAAPPLRDNLWAAFEEALGLTGLPR